MGDIHQLEETFDYFIQAIQPTSQSNDVRHRIINFLREIIEKKLPNVFLIPTGSTCSRTYLADGDLDLVLISRPSTAPSSSSSTTTNYVPSSSSVATFQSNQELQLLNSLFSILCEEIHYKESGQSKYPDFTIRNIELINARAKLVHCKVNNIGIDISFNQIGALSGLIFLEEVDHFIGNDHLFKRSLLLVKAWCLHESKKYCGYSILGSKDGMLSSYSLSIMVLYLFAKFRNSLRHPLQMLRMFLYFYQLFPWDTHVLTLEGPKFIQIGPTNNGNHKSNHHQQQTAALNYEKDFACENIFAPILHPLIEHFQHYQTQRFLLQQQLQASSSSSITMMMMPAPLTRFALRVVNIQDPIDKLNNLSYSVTRNSLQIITKALAIGYQNIEGLMIHYLKQNNNPSSSPMNVHHLPNGSSYPSPSSSANSNVVSPILPVAERRNSKNMSLASSSNEFIQNNGNINNSQKIPPNTFPQFTTATVGYPQFTQHDHQQSHQLPAHYPSEAFAYPPSSREKLKRASLNWSQNPILTETFAVSLSIYVHSIRSDLLDHPLQQSHYRSNHLSQVPLTKNLPSSPSSSLKQWQEADVLVGDPSLAENFFELAENGVEPAESQQHSPLKEDRTLKSETKENTQKSNEIDEEIEEEENGEEEGGDEGSYNENCEDGIDDSTLSGEDEVIPSSEPQNISGHSLDSPIFFKKDRDSSSSVAPTVSSTSTSQHDSDSPPSYTLPHAPIEIPLDLPLNIQLPSSKKKKNENDQNLNSNDHEVVDDEEPKEIDDPTTPVTKPTNLHQSIPSQNSNFSSGRNHNFSSIGSSSNRKKRSKSITKNQSITVTNAVSTTPKIEEKDNNNTKKALFTKSPVILSKGSPSKSSASSLFHDVSEEDDSSLPYSSFSRPLFLCLITTITIFSFGWVYYNVINPTEMIIPFTSSSSSSSTSQSSSKAFQLNPWEYSSSYLSSKPQKNQALIKTGINNEETNLLDSMIRTLIEHSSASVPFTAAPAKGYEEDSKEENRRDNETSLVAFADDNQNSVKEYDESSQEATEDVHAAQTTVEKESEIADESHSSAEIIPTDASNEDGEQQQEEKEEIIPSPLSTIGTHFLRKDESLTIGDIKSIEDYLKTGKFPFIPKQYLWQLNAQNLSITSFPFFTIEKMRPEFVGHYTCYEIIPIYSDSMSDFMDGNEEPPTLIREDLQLLLETNVEMLMKPKIRSRPFYQEVKLGKSLILSLEVEGIPPPSFQWYRNGYPLSDQLQHTLFIREVEMNHAGTYSCEVFNVAGKSLWSEVVVAVLE